MTADVAAIIPRMVDVNPEIVARASTLLVIVALLAARAYSVGAELGDRHRRRQSSPEATPSGELMTGEDLCVDAS